MRKALSVLAIFVTASAAPWLSGCSSTATSTNQIQPPPASSVPVSLTMTDDPPAGVSVLFFQVSLTAASLQPTSGSPVSLLPNGTSIQIDVTKLQALSAFLSTANVPAGSYSGLSLTFANPQLVIFNTSDQSIASTCAVGSVCQLTPAIDNSATVALSGNPFPVTVAANTPLGLLIDYHLNTIIQPDLSVNLSAANGVSVAPLVPPSAPLQPPQFGFLTGTVESVSADQTQFTVQTAWGRTFTIDTNSSTVHVDWPPCASPGALSCLSAGTVVQVQIASVESNGDLLAAQVTWLQAAGQQTVVGAIVAIPPLPLPAGETVLLVMLHQNPTASTSLPVGAVAQVAVWGPGSGGGHSVTTFSIDSNGFNIPSGFTFASPNDLGVGQTVQITVTPGTLTGPVCTTVITANGWGPPCVLSFTASGLQLEPSQITGTIASIGSGSFGLNTFPNIFLGPWSPNAVPNNGLIVETTSQTTYQGFSPDNFSGLADNDLVSVSGWVFPQNGALTPAVGPPIVVAQTITLHPNAVY
jgi:hypothetical protein